ncbi:MAG: hypothetical protein ACTHKQ_24835 [Mesorhizobium sp.]
MKVTNTGRSAHTLSHRGKEYFLAPGSFVNVEMTKAEAKAIPAPFDATGKPDEPAKVEVKDEGKKA